MANERFLGIFEVVVRRKYWVPRMEMNLGVMTSPRRPERSSRVGNNFLAPGQG